MFAAADLWAHIADEGAAQRQQVAGRRALLDDGDDDDDDDDDGDDDDDDDGPATFPFSAPSNERYWSESWALQRISAGYAWGRGVGGRSAALVDPTRVCLIDTGVDCGHPDLAGLCTDGAAFLPGQAGRYGLQYALDSNGHGTYMAGMVAASGTNNRGVAGVLYRGASLYVCKFMDADGFGAISDAVRCLSWCISKGVHVTGEAVCPPCCWPCCWTRR
jgi:subtilisin family serine protease